MPDPEKGWSLRETVTLIAETRADDFKKTQCGRDLIEWATRTLNTIRGTRG